ncbi:MAG: glycosyltransferase family 2 protein [Syntrophaceticus schinkii]|jgi:glycosyltransferase involved in cell wall biosynthesis|nr:glycosyltransferase family 2 protein [Syntrophaceticus schinkii]
MGKKVSIITPCYNGEKYLARYLDSILNQTYPHLELIFINDGSGDDTEKIALSYKEIFRERGCDFIYIFQQNAGIAAALNAGLKVFTGDYLTWPDSDDLLDLESIEKKVYFLENNKEYGFVRSDAYLYDEKNMEKPVGFVSQKSKDRFKEEIFEDLITENVHLTSGCYMARTVSFLNVNPSKQIYPSRAGQNWQMLLPLADQYKCGYIDQPLYSYILRQDSHYHSVVTLKDLLKRCEEHEDILKNVVSRLDVNHDYYDQLIRIKYIRQRLYLAGVFADQRTGSDNFQLLKQMDTATGGDKLLSAMSRNKVISLIGRGAIQIKMMLTAAIKRMRLPWSRHWLLTGFCRIRSLTP